MSAPLHQAPARADAITRSPQRDLWVLDARDDASAAKTYRAACAPLFDVSLHEGDEVFHNRLEGYNLGSLLVGRCRGVAQTFDRTRLHIQSDGQDPIQLVIQIEGAWSGDYDGRIADRTMGSVRLIDQGRPYHVETSAFETFNIMIPRSLMGAAERADLHGLVLSADRAATRILTGQISALWAALPELGQAEADAIARTIPLLLDAALTGLTPARPVQRQALPAIVMTMARREVDRRLGDETLTPVALASRLGLGRSALYRLFEEHGGVAAFIQARRLDRAFEALSHGGDRVSLAVVSQDHGFKSAAHFNRAFRARFGLPPGEMRQLARTLAAPNAAADASSVFAWLDRL